MRYRLLQNIGRLLAELDIGVGVLLQKFRKNMGQNRAGDGVLNTDMNKVRPAETAAGAVLVLLLESEYLLRGLEEKLAVLCQYKGSGAHKKGRAQLLLKLRYLL